TAVSSPARPGNPGPVRLSQARQQAGTRSLCPEWPWFRSPRSREHPGARGRPCASPGPSGPGVTLPGAADHDEWSQQPVTTSTDYSARHLQVLEGLEAVRKRPGMYIGSTDSRGLMHCLWEIIDNAVDEALGGHGDRIDVVLHQDGSVEVHDRARGIP